MRSTIQPTKGTIMAETQTDPTETAQTEQPEVSQNFVQRAANKHPRLAKAVAVTGAALSIVGIATVARTVRSNKGHLEAAGEHLSEAGSEFVATVDPASPEV
jgi:hypothetical protein